MESPFISDLSMSLFNTIPDPFFIISEDGTYLEVLGGTERSLYDDGKPMKGKNIYQFMEKEFSDYFMHKIRETLAGTTLNCFEYQLETNKVVLPAFNGPGGMQWFEARMFPMPNPYLGHRAVTTMIINITDRKVLQQRLKELSYLDPLTSLANRRYFMERIAEELEEHYAKGTSVHVLLCDLDHFKLINDLYGHLAGDAVLKGFASVVRQVLKHSHTIARFGGDEFIISLVGMTTVQVLEKSNELRLAVQEHQFMHEGLRIPVCISIGVAVASSQTEDIDGLVGLADKALYIAKKQGRNRVVLSQDEVN
ncbi:MAG: sensor domain-containing diguanylate cyclase [Spirochaetia bacterium]|nr:sensor domain-containing diguanylate cyclase [Spirochaetia bacterium]